MGEFAGKMQMQFKKSSSDIGLFALRMVSGGIFGLTFALIMQEILGKADNENLIAFFFVIIVTTAAFLRISKQWGLVTVLVFDLVMVLIGLALRLYIMVAPNA